MNDGSIPGPISLNAHELRMLTDMAQSLRGPNGDPIYIFPDPNSDDGGVSVQAGGNAPADTVFTVSTFDVAPDRQRPQAVTIEHGGTVQQLQEKYDAVFWSESAVEKFMLPYYASKSMWDAAAALSELSLAWYGKVPTDKDVSSQAPPVSEAFVVSGDQLPIALAHTPDSDWSAEPPTDEFHVLFTDQAGFRPMPLSEFVQSLREPAPAAADRAPQSSPAPAAA